MAQNENSRPAGQIMLIEVVSAYDLEFPKDIKNIDPYCVCSVGSTQIHRTAKVSKSSEPIWTITTHSLFLLNVEEYGESIENGLEFRVEHSGIFRRANKAFDLGKVCIPYAEIMAGTGERKVYKLYKNANINKSCGYLCLRFRCASEEDIKFIELKQRHPKLRAIRPTIYKECPRIKHSSKPRSKDRMERVKPYANPEDMENTSWMTKERIEDECIKPSLTWIKSGKGISGRIFVELIKCDHLQSKYDSFAGIIVEDTFVKTDIIQCTSKPRWLPWVRRAFILPIVHPRSPVLLGIFHHEKMGSTLPIGRVVIDLAKLKNSVEYFLTFQLHSDPILRQKKPVGTATIRIRLKWKEEIDLMSQNLIDAPRYHVNVESEKEFKIIRYLCKGEVNMQNPSLETISGLMRELSSYGTILFYSIDVLAQTLLWRVQGIERENENNFMPAQLRIHSTMLFLASITVVEYPFLFPSSFFFGLTWILLTRLYHGSRDPSPWKRTRSFFQIFRIAFSGKPTKRKSFNIKSWEGYRSTKEMKELKILKAKRISNIVYAVMKTALKYKRKYTITSVDAISIENEDKTWVLFGEYLYYIHLPLYYLCQILRGTGTLISWNLWSDSVRFTLMFFFSGLFCLFLPWHRILLWILRLVCWMYGPWIILLDERFIRPYFRTDQDLLDAKEPITPNFRRIFETDNMKDLEQIVRTAYEDAYKLKDMRSYLFGNFSQAVPSTAISAWKDRPLPESSAKLVDNAVIIEEDYITHGQKLQGNMIHVPA